MIAGGAEKVMQIAIPRAFRAIFAPNAAPVLEFAFFICSTARNPIPPESPHEPFQSRRRPR